MQPATLLRFALICLFADLLVSCATAPATAANSPVARRVTHVRTTAYCGNEGGSGAHNATGERLAGRNVRSAASDWSRYPLGTRFRVAGSTDEYIVDDYGGAVVGTDTIDLSLPNRAAVHSWGVRHVDLEVLEWGSHERSLHVLRPRKASRLVRRMIASIEGKKS